jgi:hypothetical protein
MITGVGNVVLPVEDQSTPRSFGRRVGFELRRDETGTLITGTDLVAVATTDLAAAQPDARPHRLGRPAWSPARATIRSPSTSTTSRPRKRKQPRTQRRNAMARQSGEQERLAALVGRWRMQGRTRETAEAPATRIEALDTYEWLPGRFALLHTVDARVGNERIEGAEIIGWDAARGTMSRSTSGATGRTPTRRTSRRRTAHSSGGCGASRTASRGPSAKMATRSSATGSSSTTRSTGGRGWTSP